MRLECTDDFSKALSTSGDAMAIEVRNLPDFSSSEVAPEVFMMGILNPKLRLLRDFDETQGDPIRRAWCPDAETLVLELQSKWLVASTARVLDDLPLFGSKLHVRIVPLAEVEATEQADDVSTIGALTYGACL
jgi:hypothetical protein